MATMMTSLARSALPLVALTAAVPTNQRSSSTPAPAAPAASRPPVPRSVQRGVALGLFAEDIGFSYAPLLAEIAAVGATHVALVVSVHQTDAASTDLRLHTRLSPSLSALADAIRAARREHLEVTVLPIVRLAAPRSPDEWRGTLAPADRAAWFRRYGDLLGDLASIAELCGASRLVVGSELSTLDGPEDLPSWRLVIDRVRALFHGRLVYSANWDHYRAAALFDLVDEDGVVAYFPLRPGGAAPADAESLLRGWRALRAEIEAWRTSRPHPFVFTEVGYRSRSGSTAEPWNEAPGGTVDLDEQRRGFQAFRRAWAGAPSLAGAYVWNWYGWGGTGSHAYTPRGKPAEAEVRQLLGEL